MKNTFSMVFAVAVVVVAAGCGNKSPQQAAQDTQSMVKMNGSWAADCKNLVDLPGFGASTREQFDFSNSDFTYKKFYFDKADCQPAQAGVIIVTGTIDRQGNSPQVGGAEQVNFNFRKATVQAESESGKSKLEGLHVCEVKDYPLHQPVDVTVNSTKLNCPVGAIPRTTYDIVLVNDNHLYFGHHAEANKPELRPSAIESDRVYTKQ